MEEQREELEISAKSVEQAIEKALEQLGLGLDEVEVTVLQKGRPGILGLGAEEARIRVSPRQPSPPAEPEEAKLAKEVVQSLLELMGLPATIRIQLLASPVPGQKALSLDIEGEDLGILIGRRGQTLASFQYIVNAILAYRLKARLPVSIDIEGYKQRRYENLRALALRMAERVKATGRTMALEPMPANERRVVHLALANHTQVTTQSVGEEEMRRVTIIPKRPAPPGMTR